MEIVGWREKDAAVAGSEDQPIGISKAADKYSNFSFGSIVFYRIRRIGCAFDLLIT